MKSKTALTTALVALLFVMMFKAFNIHPARALDASRALCLLQKTVSSAMLLSRVPSRFLLLLISVIETDVPGSVTQTQV
jgi:hypothetical protein